MNKKFWAIAGIVLAGILLGAYFIFLISPIFINPLINKYQNNYIKEINKAIGFNIKANDIKFVTTPKLTVGFGVSNINISTVEDKTILDAEDAQIKMSLIPLLAKKIELDLIKFKNANIYLELNNSGEFEIEKYVPKTEENEISEPVVIPFGLTISNHLPDIKIEKYVITFANNSNKYVASGENTEITDFVLNKHVKVKGCGNFVLNNREQFRYNVQIFNKIMPDLELNDMILNPSEEEVKENNDFKINIADIFKEIYKNNVRGNVDTKLKIEPENINGNMVLSGLSVFNLPESNVNLEFKGKSIDIDSKIYTDKNEISTLKGFIRTGKKPDINLKFKSQAEITNILRIVKEIALIFNVQDLKTLSANGKIDANFDLKSDLKSIISSGYFKIPDANLYYGLYKIGIDDINTDIQFNNNNVNIKNIGFSVLNHPLKFYGTISNKADCNLHLTASNLNIKGLLVALAQTTLLKDNNFYSGDISINADIKGKLDNINPVIKVILSNINIKNIPSNTSLKAPSTVLNITSDGKTFTGNGKSTNINAINPSATVSVPEVKLNINQDEIEITQTPVRIEKININVSGKIKNYLQEKMNINFVTTGDIKSTLSGDINSAKQSLKLTYLTTSPSTIIIPMFDKSKMTFSSNISIGGNINNPILNGTINIPNLEIPEIPVKMTNLDINLQGKILNGNATLQNFTSGGIIAENITSDFSLIGNNFHLKNLKGNSFNGKINGNIIYNLANLKTNLDFTGEGLNATSAIYGATGIKNALSGTLDFKTSLSLTVTDYNEMMKSLKGNLTFNVKNGAFASIGRLENILQADNIITDGILKNTVNAIINAAGLADTAKFDYISGDLNFANGYANLKPVKSSGPLLAYYIKGKYNLINGSAILTILGRLDSKVVAKLGPLGELSANKILSYIPKLGNLTASLANKLSTSPKGEDINSIPQLSSGSTEFKNFKVLVNGVVGKPSAIKSFKWLNDVDTSAIETKTVKETLQDIKTSVNEDFSNTVQDVSDAISNSKEQLNAAKEQLKNSAEELKNLFKF